MYSPGKSAYDVGAGFLVEKSGNTTGSNIAIVVKEGQTANNLVFKPMICSKADWDISQQYVPYRPSYDELVTDTAETTKALGGLSLIKCTQAEYDAMSVHDENTLYIITEGAS